MSQTHDLRPRTAVLLQHTGIGDLVWHRQYFKAVAAQSHAGRVTVIAQPSTLAKALLSHEPWLEAVIDHDHRPRRGDKRKGQHAGLAGMWRMARQLREGKFDRLVLFSGRPSRGLIAGLSGIPIRLGYGYHWWQRIFLTQGPYIQRHRGAAVAVFHDASTFAVAQGFCASPITPALDIPQAIKDQMATRMASWKRPLYALAIGTSEPCKQWGAPNFAALAQALIAQGAGVMLLGGPAEAAIAAQISTLIPEPARQHVWVLTDVPVLASAAALQLVDACIGNDTGMVNVAAAVGCTSLVLMGDRRPLDHDPRIINVHADSLSAVTVAQVMSALDRVTDHIVPSN